MLESPDRVVHPLMCGCNVLAESRRHGNHLPEMVVRDLRYYWLAITALGLGFIDCERNGSLKSCGICQPVLSR